MAKTRPGVVSVVLVNFRGADDTIEAIRYLGELSWPREFIEIVVVENASGDNSAERIRAAAPHVKLVESRTNEGFAGGCNLGVAASTGEVIALLNNDARPDPGWVRAAMAVFAESDDVGAVASKVLDWDGELVDYIGSAMTWYGMGYKPFTAERPPRVPETRADVLFGTGSAMFVRRSVWDAVDGFDERYFMFFEDVDLGWRINLAGWRYVYEPASLAFHKHHASMSAFGSFKETQLLERNALFTLYKNVGEKYLHDALPGAMGLSIRRAITRGGLDSTSFDLRTPGGDSESTMSVDKGVMSSVFAIDQFVEQLPSLRAARDKVQAMRKVPESRIRRLFGNLDAPVIQDKEYLSGYEKIVASFDLLEVPGTTKVLVITGDPIGARLAGPAIRAWNMAEALSRDNDVVLVSMSRIEEMDAPFRLMRIAAGDDRSFAPLERWADVIIFQGHAMAVFDSLRRSEKIIVADIYDPMHLEQLEQGRELPTEQWERQVSDATAVLNEQLERADFLLAASERQKMFWLGQLAALGRINPAVYDQDPDLDGLICVVPFGLSVEPPRHDRDVLKGVAPGIGRDDKLLLWSGGLYNWFDPQTLIRAVALLSERRPTVRLFFQGTKHPHPGVPEMAIVEESRRLAADLGVLNSAVFFNDSWVAFDERQNYLLEADAGVSTHHAHIETTFSFRTRILDYLWAELPMVVTEGDHFADLIEREGLGIVVPAQDVEALADALEQVLFDGKVAGRARENIKRVRESYFWHVTLAPLVDFVAAARHAADRTDGSQAEIARKRRLRRRSGIGHDARLAWMYLRTSGAKVVLAKVLRRLRRR